MTVVWSANGNPLDVSTYTAVLSTGAVFPNLHSGNITLSTVPAGAAPAATFTGLAADTTYYLFVDARNWAGRSSGYSALGSTITLTVLPASAASTFTAVFETSMTVFWLANGNPLDVTTYTVVLSTGAVFPNANPGNVSISTVPAGAAPAATLTGLGANTTYFVFVDARNWSRSSSGYAALGATCTLASPPAAAAVTFVAVATEQVTASWLANGNPLDITTYTVVLSTGAAFPNTYSGNVALATAPVGALPTATFTGLSVDATYYLFAAAQNWDNSRSPYSALGSTITLAAPPASAASTFTAVFGTSMTVAWLANGNPVDVTTYTVVLSTGAAFPNSYSGNVLRSTVPLGAAPSASVTGLNANTTYFLFVDARNWSNASSGYSALGSTCTSAAPPSAAAAVFLAISPDAKSVAWLPNGNPLNVTTYTVVLSTGASFPNTYAGNAMISTAPAGAVLSARLTGLSPNTTYNLFVDARNWEGQSSGYGYLGSSATRVYAPASAVDAFTLVRYTSMTVTWLPNGNPLDVTTYTVVLTSSPVFPNSDIGNVQLSTVPIGGVPSATLHGLNPAATYYLFVDARNWNHASSGYVYLGSTVTLPLVRFALIVRKTGPGRVWSAPVGVDCGAACSAFFSSGTVVVLSTGSVGGSVFNVWGGACSGVGSCMLTMTEDLTVDAVFDPPSRLAVNFPNPFGHAGTRFAYRLDQPADVRIQIYTLSGRAVRTLADPGRPLGYSETWWDGKNDAGREVARGVYIYRMVFDRGGSQTVNMGKCTKRE
jgi:hypothetical protein